MSKFKLFLPYGCTKTYFWYDTSLGTFNSLRFFKQKKITKCKTTESNICAPRVGSTNHRNEVEPLSGFFQSNKLIISIILGSDVTVRQINYEQEPLLRYTIMRFLSSFLCVQVRRAVHSTHQFLVKSPTKSLNSSHPFFSFKSPKCAVLFSYDKHFKSAIVTKMYSKFDDLKQKNG